MVSRGRLGICIDKHGLFYLDMEIRSVEDEERFHERCKRIAGSDMEPIILSEFQVCFNECVYHCYLEYDDCRSECTRTCLTENKGVR